MAEPRTERLGVSAVEHYFSRYGWLFREQFTHDYGIDAQVEIVRDGQPTGALIGIQIKSGESYFKEETVTAYIYRTDDRHVSYWSQHVLPVILVLYSPGRDECYWQCISDDTLQSTGKAWKLEVPKENRLSEESLVTFQRLIQPPPYLQKLNRIRLDRHWIELLSEDETVYVEFEDWINKSLPRFQMKIGCNSRSDIPEETWPTTYGIGFSIEDALKHLLPWADYEMDLDAHREYMRSVHYDECYSWYDKETGTTVFTQSFDDWYQEPYGLAPVYADGEIEGYRLLLRLNEIGRGFLSLDDYLSEDDGLASRVFTI